MVNAQHTNSGEQDLKYSPTEVVRHEEIRVNKMHFVDEHLKHLPLRAEHLKVRIFFAAKLVF
jgi:hypothetical protein